MAFPSKTNYLSGDVLTAAQMNDIGSEINALNGTAGKNKIINGDFNINQRKFTSTTTNGDYGFDRWQLALSGATATYSAQTFTVGAAPVAGYESKNFARLATTTGNDNCRIQQLIEDVRTFAGQTVTVSFYAKGTNPTTAGNLAVWFIQEFGTGGSPSAQVTVTQQTFVLTANWTRYSLTFQIPSISGKTLGTTENTNYLGLLIGQGSSTSTDSWTLDIWGVQVEAGSVATAFQTATGTLAGELALCQRYYYRQTAPDAYSNFGIGFAVNTTSSRIGIVLPVPMRTKPSTTVESANLALYDGTNIHAPSSITIGENNTQTPSINFSYAVAILTANRPYSAISNNSTAAYLGFSAEL